MQDFLKDRPVLALQDAKIVVPAAASTTQGGVNPFARIVRDESAALSSSPAAPAPARGGAAVNPAAPHTSQIKTVMENGRVARLIVTCSCGKVTEIACVY